MTVIVPTLIAAEGVTCAYRGRDAVVDVDLAIAEGEFLGIVGPSGSGKTTLLKALLGTIRPATGRVDRRPGLRLGYVPQVESVNWQFPVTVGECVLMARAARRRLPWCSRHERAQVRDVLERLGIADLEHRHIRALSGGQQQRVFVARALLGQPDVLLMDEPTSGVDVRTRHEVLHLLDDLNVEGLAVVITTHDLNGIAAHLPRLLCLNTRVIAHGPSHAVLTAEVLQRTYGAPMTVLAHGGMAVVVDAYHPTADVIEMRRRRA
jgi:ABC-type Mn2+/Zn2+ transport system ATPase subunit